MGGHAIELNKLISPCRELWAGKASLYSWSFGAVGSVLYSHLPHTDPNQSRGLSSSPARWHRTPTGWRHELVLVQ